MKSSSLMLVAFRRPGRLQQFSPPRHSKVGDWLFRNETRLREQQGTGDCNRHVVPDKGYFRASAIEHGSGSGSGSEDEGEFASESEAVLSQHLVDNGLGPSASCRTSKTSDHLDVYF